MKYLKKNTNLYLSLNASFTAADQHMTWCIMVPNEAFTLWSCYRDRRQLQWRESKAPVKELAVCSGIGNLDNAILVNLHGCSKSHHRAPILGGHCLDAFSFHLSAGYQPWEWHGGARAVGAGGSWVHSRTLEDFEFLHILGGGSQDVCHGYAIAHNVWRHFWWVQWYCLCISHIQPIKDNSIVSLNKRVAIKEDRWSTCRYQASVQQNSRGA